MNITIDENCVFTYSLPHTIHIYRHRDGKYTGPIACVGKIEFADRGQMLHFVEMIDLCMKRRTIS